MNRIEARRPMHKESVTDKANQREEDEELHNQGNEEKATEKKDKPKSLSRENQSNTAWIKHIFYVSIVVLAVGIYLWNNLSHEEKGVIDIANHPETIDESKLSEDLETLEQTYSKQELETWVSLASGIKSVVREKPNKPSVFLMLYDTYSAGKTAKCIAVDASKKATKYLISRAESPVIINPSELGNQRYLQDPGLVLTEYNNTIRARGALVVPDLQDVPPKVAEIFHFICDKYTPLVNTAVMFFTLKVDRLPKNVLLQTVATETLEKLWSHSMKDSSLHPLITRMTPNIVNIFSDSANC